jgi:hypothetical protein
MGDKPPPPNSTRGVFEVRIARAGKPITPTCVFFHFSHVVRARMLILTPCRDVNTLLKGGSASPETAMATNLLQLLVRQHSNKLSWMPRSLMAALKVHPLATGSTRTITVPISPTLKRFHLEEVLSCGVAFSSKFPASISVLLLNLLGCLQECPPHTWQTSHQC